MKLNRALTKHPRTREEETLWVEHQNILGVVAATYRQQIRTTTLKLPCFQGVFQNS
eukprot:m.768379 g.768379  ORF g.768379 m.768379 type:complete len:56 (+) comp23227_c0_seq78:993-1160(+)